MISILQIFFLWIGVLMGLFCFCIRSRITYRHLAGKFEYPLLGSVPQFLNIGTWNFYTIYKEKLGADTFVVWFGRKPIVFTSDADIAKKTLQINVRGFMFDNDPTTREVEEVGRFSELLWARKPVWQDLRRIMNISFSPDAMPCYFESVTKACDSMSKEVEKYISNGENMDPFYTAKYFTTMVIMGAAFGVPLDIQKPNERQKINNINQFCYYQLHEDTKEFYRTITRLVNFVIPDWLQFLRNIGIPVHKIQRIEVPQLYNFSQYIVDLIKQESKEYETLFNEIQLKQNSNKISSKNPLESIKDWKNNTKPGMLVEHLLKGFVDGKRLNYDQVLVNIASIVVAGNDTTATTIGATLFLVAKNQEVQQKILEEIDNFGRNRQVTYEDIDNENISNNFGYLNACVSETLRLYPAASVFGRQIINDRFYIGRQKLTRGSYVSVDVRGMHCNEKYWKDPKIYVPERFLDPNSKYAQKHPNAYCPFGSGARMCLGYRLARLEALLSLITLFQKFQFNLPGNMKDIELDFTGDIVILPKQKIYVIPQLRQKELILH